MKHLGDFDTSAVIYGKFTTFRPSTGAAYTLGGTPALSVYKDASTTQSTTGVTLTADFDSVTGLNHFAIDTSADGTFYSSGSFFDVVITTGTVDSVSVVGAVVGSFTLRKNSALKPATAGRTVVVDASGLVDANTVKVGPTGSGTPQTARDIGASVLLSSGTGTGQLDFTSGVVKADATKVGGQTASASGTVTFPNATLASTTNITAGTITTVGTLTGHTPQTGDSYARIGVAGAGLTALGDTRIANLDATVSSRLASASYTAAPSAATNASAVRTELTTELGRIDAAISTRLADASYTAPPSAATNASTLLGTTNGAATVATQLQHLDADVSSVSGGGGGSGSGPGADSVTLTITDDGAIPIPDAEVWITTTSASSPVYAGYLITNAQGEVTFMLNAGDTYYLWMQARGYNSIEGQSFVAVAD